MSKAAAAANSSSLQLGLGSCAVLCQFAPPQLLGDDTDGLKVKGHDRIAFEQRQSLFTLCCCTVSIRWFSRLAVTAVAAVVRCLLGLLSCSSALLQCSKSIDIADVTAGFVRL
jgi:hypothetical protein